MTNMIAQTILEQIQEGGFMFKAVDGSQFVALEDGMQFRVKGDKFAGKVVIKLNAMDTYDIEFWDIRLDEDIIEKVDEVNDIYNDQLAEVLWNRIVIV